MLKNSLEYLEDFMYDVKRHVDNLIYWFRYRTYDRYNIIKISSLKPDYYDTDTRMLHGMFDLLVDFIEIEKAHMHKVFSEEFRNQNYFKKELYWALHLFTEVRDREQGLAYLDWEINESDCKGQAECAKEQKELYLWWKDIRPNRKDPMDLSGWSDFCDKYRHKLWIFKPCEDSPELSELVDTLTPEEREEERKILDKLHEVEMSQELEDEVMLTRLIRIRKSLWT